MTYQIFQGRSKEIDRLDESFFLESKYSLASSSNKKLFMLDEDICAPAIQPLVDLAEVRSIELDINLINGF